MALLCKDVRKDLFESNHPVYTKVRDRVPTYYGAEAEVERSLIADGCYLEGEVEDSVLFRQVTVEEGAEVENCIIMNNCVIGKGAKVKNVILDKDVTVKPGAEIIGSKDEITVYKKGATV